MTKADLKDGMIVELGDHTLMLVIQNKLVDKSSYTILGNFNDDLTHTAKYRDDMHIMKVYTTVGKTLNDMFDRRFLREIWCREPIKEMTISQLEELLGYKIKIVGEDNDS